MFRAVGTSQEFSGKLVCFLELGNFCMISQGKIPHSTLTIVWIAYVVFFTWDLVSAKNRAYSARKCWFILTRCVTYSLTFRLRLCVRIYSVSFRFRARSVSWFSAITGGPEESTRWPTSRDISWVSWVENTPGIGQ